MNWRIERLYYGQDAFDNIDDKYKEELTDEMVTSLRTAFHHTNVPLFMAELHECILLHLAVKQDTNAEDYADNVEYP